MKGGIAIALKFNAGKSTQQNALDAGYESTNLLIAVLWGAKQPRKCLPVKEFTCEFPWSSVLTALLTVFDYIQMQRSSTLSQA